MKECMGQDEICVITEYSQKMQWEKQFRYLWRNCFRDPIKYEDFYFEKVYPKNAVYALDAKGMVHLNQYRCKVFDQDVILPYIVGVSTDEKYRRHGVMRRLLERVFSDLYAQRVPFTYLMPAKEEYYTDFGFQRICKREECDIYMHSEMYSNHIKYVSYCEIQKLSTDAQLQLFAKINQWLAQRYVVYAIRDKSYYDLLYIEKLCQRGDVVFCFEDEIAAEQLCGVFAYVLDGELPYIEQLVMKNGMIQSIAEVSGLVGSYFQKMNRVCFVKSYPYMLRIVHRDSFLELFGQELSKVCNESIDEMTDTQLIELLFQEKDNIYFAEII